MLEGVHLTKDQVRVYPLMSLSVEDLEVPMLMMVVSLCLLIKVWIAQVKYQSTTDFTMTSTNWRELRTQGQEEGL
jgi:hypothetical protein